MQSITLSELETLAAGLAALTLGNALGKRLKILERLDIPNPVVGGVLAASCVALLRSNAGVEVHFATKLSDFLLLMFFTTVGLSAKLSALKAGGKPLLILCAATVLMIVAQNITGVLVAFGYGAHPYYGLLIGSISLVGGPGTAAAWASEARAVGLENASEVAVAGATLAVIAGALVAGPLTGWLVKRNNLDSRSRNTEIPWADPRSVKPAASQAPVEMVMRTTLLIVVSVIIGDALNSWARSAGLVLPGFLTSMLGGVLITNVADMFGTEIDFGPIERNGQIALQSFLVMYLMSLKLWVIGEIIMPLVINVILQIIVTGLIAYFFLFRKLGRDYDAALTVGGFIGFGLSSMAVGMATMDKVANRYGPSPKAFLLITLAGSFFVDLANALLVQLFLVLPIFH
jgi:ESS family glutamate:Na+ symporter